MDENRKFVLEAQVERTMKALAKNQMPAVYAPTKAAAVKAVEAMLREGETISCGGSVTLAESGIRDLMKSGRYQFIDREEMDPREAYLKTFDADVFLTSANAITEDGELYNVDGNGNRVAAMTFGPASVILVVGANKIVRDLAEAEQRVKEFAAPANCKRLACKTPCAVTGKCADCSGDGRICCTAVVHRQQRIPGRIKVILVEESLGY